MIDIPGCSERTNFIFELREVLEFRQLDFCHHNLVCLSTVTHRLGKNYFDQCRGWVNKKLQCFSLLFGTNPRYK